MNAYLLSLLFILNTSFDKTPNFYPNYIAAREASKNYNKDLLIFFSKKACAACDVAWTNFEKDPVASKIYISTSLSIQDFDGAVFLDKYGLQNAPAWLVLDPQGQVKDKWEGEWKKTPTRPTTPKPETAAATSTETEKASTATTTSAITPAVTPEANPVIDPVKSSSVTPSKPTPAVETNEDAEIVIEKEKGTTKEIVTAKVATPITEQQDKNVKEAVDTPIVPQAAGYVIQAGFFSSQANAKGLITSLDMKGFNNFSIKPSMREGTTYYRVISAAYPTENEAQITVDDMLKVDVKAAIKKQQEIEE